MQYPSLNVVFLSCFISLFDFIFSINFCKTKPPALISSHLAVLMEAFFSNKQPNNTKQTQLVSLFHHILVYGIIKDLFGSKLCQERSRLDIRTGHSSKRGWSNTGSGFLERWLMLQACQCLRVIWTMPLITF